MILIATTYDAGTPKWFAAPLAVAVITAGGVFYAWIWDRSHTMWTAAIAHNTVNSVFDCVSSWSCRPAGSAPRASPGRPGSRR